MALLFGFVGFFTNPFLLFIALFVWIGAAAEASMVQVRAALSGIPVRRAMNTEFRTLGPRDPLRRAAEALLAGSQQDFPVVDGSGVVGVLLRADLIAALAAQRHEASVGEVMRREFAMVDSHEMLDRAFARLQRGQVHTAPVMHDRRLVGLITMDNIGEFVAVQGALEAVEA
jgi:predicted transcriptional regulator